MTRRKRDPGSGVTPLDGTELVYAETQQPIPHEPTPSRRRRAPLAADPTPAYACVQALAEQIEQAQNRDEIERVAAAIRGRELRAERNHLDAELDEVKDLVQQFQSLFPRDLVPTSLITRFDRVRDAIVENDAARREVRYTLAPGVDLEHATLDRERKQAARQAEQDARAVKTAAALEAVLETGRVEGRKEYAAVVPVIERLFAHPHSGRVVDPVTASAHRSEMAAARASVRHPLHATSQYTTFRGDPVMIFTGR
ncbi:hypothetical protein N865_19670 [Intrasporangium oryzae NRRL B-24470]|uniref:Uncharacterized protein n=1 Tax=Intrasporangium oryzae NRRL B-24470 TaxID=1386089 RepID=W9G1U9_9MICO|nr:hypothetical protein [Intrasporangium oryzae]EWS99939.1 hypothetical protein N865_19670 [Intrasporangium oryzae NRRL B-24470]